jgi:hypothetical protein
MSDNALSDTVLLNVMLICGLILIDHLLLYDDYLRILPRSVVIAAVQKLYLARLIRCKGVLHLTVVFKTMQKTELKFRAHGNRQSRTPGVPQPF